MYRKNVPRKITKPTRKAAIVLPCMCANLRRAARVVTQLYDEELRPSGLRASQFTLLQTLNIAPGISQKRLAGVLEFDSTTLTRTLAFLRRQGTETAGCSFGDCRLDEAAHKFYRAGAEVALTAKEFKLLEFFVKRAGRALTRDSILDAVWGHDIIVTDRSVDRCVTTLRAKIEADPHDPKFIQTIRDIGYRFETGT